MRLILFAKAPIPGHAKTRLLPLLGAQGAAQFHKNLVRECLTTLSQISSARVELHYDQAHPFFLRLAKTFDCQLRAQTGTDLGQRMLNALRSAKTPGMIMGSDCPMIRAELIRRCRTALTTHDLVILPAADGGYGLIGCQKPQQSALYSVFDSIPWGTAEVMARTRQAIAKTQLSMQELDQVWDIDTPADWQRWQQWRVAVKTY